MLESRYMNQSIMTLLARTALAFGLVICLNPRYGHWMSYMEEDGQRRGGKRRYLVYLLALPFRRKLTQKSQKQIPVHGFSDLSVAVTE